MTIIKSRGNREPDSAKSLALGELRSMSPTFLMCDGLTLIVSGICGLAGLNVDWRVLSGLVVGNAVTALNFFLIGVTAGYVIRRKNPEKAKRFSGVSYGARYVGMFIVFGALLCLRCVNPVTALVPLFFPKIHYTLTALSNKKN